MEKEIQISRRFLSDTGLRFSQNTSLISPDDISENVGFSEWARTAEVGDTYIASDFAATCVPKGKRRRICSHCGQPIQSECFVIYDGCEYYCGRDCLHRHYSEKDWTYFCEHTTDDGGFDGDPNRLPESMRMLTSANTYYTEFDNDGYID